MPTGVNRFAGASNAAALGTIEAPGTLRRRVERLGPTPARATDRQRPGGRGLSPGLALAKVPGAMPTPHQRIPDPEPLTAAKQAPLAKAESAARRGAIAASSWGCKGKYQSPQGVTAFSEAAQVLCAVPTAERQGTSWVDRQPNTSARADDKGSSCNAAGCKLAAVPELGTGQPVSPLGGIHQIGRKCCGKTTAACRLDVPASPKRRGCPQLLHGRPQHQ